jgi:hypothetical protein
MFAAIAVCVWVTMSKISFIIIMLELDLESKRMIKTTSFLLHTVLVVANVLAISLPSYT